MNRNLSGLTQRRIAKGQPVGPIVHHPGQNGPVEPSGSNFPGGEFSLFIPTDANGQIISRRHQRPLEWWQALELETVEKVERLRSEGRI